MEIIKHGKWWILRKYYKKEFGETIKYPIIYCPECDFPLSYSEFNITKNDSVYCLIFTCECGCEVKFKIREE